jgi:aryl sulfotransferase
MTNALPQRTIHYRGGATNPDRWDAYTPREDDIFICTPEKAGTTWTQTMVAMLLLGTTDLDPPATVISPWVDAELMPLDMMVPMLEGQHHRRFLKTHTPLDGIPFVETGTYICVFRDLRDIHFSMRNHVLNMKNDMFDDQFPEDVNEGFRRWVDLPHVEGAQEVFCLEALVNHYQTFKAFEHLENIHIFHYAEMTADPAAALNRLADILDLIIAPDLLEEILQASSFNHMKANAERFVPGAGMNIWHKESNFFNKGAGRQWEGVITEENLAAYDARMAELLPTEDVAWLEGGY